MDSIVALLVPIACGCILPIFAIWMGVRRKINETNQRTQIVLAAIEKNPDMDLEELMKKISPQKNSNDLRMLYLAGAILLAVGIAFLISYSKGKKMLAKEIEAEEKKLIAEANS